ncbi:MAG TPA: YARHG domain-containing protein [Cyclobacteriaceae bacterium]|jgi:hypothetical protein|nr:YARHG domain-containing protein [Cyclobacteriaceae bacterium]
MRLFLLLVFISTQTFGQWIASEEIDKSKVQNWFPKLVIEYQGVYHFGDSESESDLVLIFVNGKVIGQIQSGSWSDSAWVRMYENLGEIKIEGNRFSSKKATGEFVTYDNGREKVKGLKVTEPWSGIPEPGQWEIGLKKSNLEEFYDGSFIQASIALLDQSDLMKLTASDLRLMRNEIFARYGLKFKKGGEMDNYFRKQSWYVPQRDNVDKFLTSLERDNIKLIQEIEGNR